MIGLALTNQINREVSSFNRFLLFKRKEKKRNKCLTFLNFEYFLEFCVIDPFYPISLFLNVLKLGPVYEKKRGEDMKGTKKGGILLHRCGFFLTLIFGETKKVLPCFFYSCEM